MRALKTLLTLSISLIAMALAANAAYAAVPFAEASDTTEAPTSIAFSGSINPNGSETEVWVEYAVSSSCTPDMDPGSLPLLQQTGSVTLSSELNSWQPASVTAFGLPNETEYCFRFAAENSEGIGYSYFWGASTTAPAPEFGTPTFDGGTSSIFYNVDYTANTNWYVANITAEYFEKTEVACDDYTGDTITAENWGPGGGFQGFTPQNVSSAVSMYISADKTYCIRLKGSNGHGNSSTPYVEVATVAPKPAVISNVKLGPDSSVDPDIDATLSYKLNDMGAYDDVGNINDYRVAMFENTPERCNADDYFGGDQVLDVSSGFTGVSDESVDIYDLELGQSYCVTITVESAWGDAYDTTIYEPVWFGESPTVGVGSVTGGEASITFDMTIAPGHLATSHRLQYFKSTADGNCADELDAGAIVEDGPSTSIETDLNETHTISSTVDELDQAAYYCARVLASNSWNTVITVWELIKTRIVKAQAEIVDFSMQPSGFSVDVDDKGAGIDTESQSVHRTYIFELPASSCNAAGTIGESPFTSNQDGFVGEDTNSIEIVGFPAGTALCARMLVESAWGDAYDVLEYWSFFLPSAPQLPTPTATRTKTSITLNTTMPANWDSTTLRLAWFLAVDPTCDETPAYINGGATAGESGEPYEVSIAADGLSPGTTYCVGLVAENDWGTAGPEYQQVTTIEATAPSVPANLAASNVTQTSATLSWDASTDDTEVAGYRVFEGANEVAEGPGTTYNVALSCGQSRTFTVRAVDTNDNESAASAAFTVTAAACPGSPPSEPPVQNQPTSCFENYKKTITVKKSGKNKAGKVVVTGRPSADRQSITVSAKASGGAKQALVGTKKSQTLVAAGTVKLTYKIGKKIKKASIKLSKQGC